MNPQRVHQKLNRVGQWIIPRASFPDYIAVQVAIDIAGRLPRDRIEVAFDHAVNHEGALQIRLGLPGPQTPGPTVGFRQSHFLDQKIQGHRFQINQTHGLRPVVVPHAFQRKLGELRGIGGYIGHAIHDGDDLFDGEHAVRAEIIQEVPVEGIIQFRCIPTEFLTEILGATDVTANEVTDLGHLVAVRAVAGTLRSQQREGGGGIHTRAGRSQPK
ncbi:MAG: hypothetical protein BWX84_01335 [Verrucomicrobia bacterium ADurb.Bin118]|nr:MAG: hypothetical protein BWX84_01335 [Verrucomicrobia bacterium ADurb.Bin118]